MVEGISGGRGDGPTEGGATLGEGLATEVTDEESTLDTEEETEVEEEVTDEESEDEESEEDSEEEGESDDEESEDKSSDQEAMEMPSDEDIEDWTAHITGVKDVEVLPELTEEKKADMEPHEITEYNVERKLMMMDRETHLEKRGRYKEALKASIKDHAAKNGLRPKAILDMMKQTASGTMAQM